MPKSRRRQRPRPPPLHHKTTQAWLDPVHLPSRAQLTCPVTGDPLRFLLQVYSPLGDDDAPAAPEAFHRTLYVFVSPRGDSLAAPGAVRALRCQLARENAFYPYDPPGEGDVVPPELKVGRGGAGRRLDGWVCWLEGGSTANGSRWE